jgi:hypothetical protein
VTDELGFNERTFEVQSSQSCPTACESTWYVRAMHNGLAAWQRVRSMCSSGETAKCCEQVAAQLKPGVCRDADVCAGASAGCAKGSPGNFMFGIGVGHSFPFPLANVQGTCTGVAQCLPGVCPLGFTSGKATAPCCCAKACTCCESCKGKPATTGNVPAFPQAPPVRWVPPGVFQPMNPPSVTWTAPVPMPPMGSRVVVGLPTSGTTSKPAHLVTPELEAHCQRIIHRDHLIILEGNVMLLCKKHAQPIRIEAQRVLVNMRDGSFTVDSTVALTPTTSSTTFSINSTNGLTGSYRVETLPTVSPRVVPVHPGTVELPAARIMATRVERADAAMVHARDQVRVMAYLGSSELHATGEAMQDGAFGQTIRVRNTETGHIVAGVVVAKGIVIVESR